MTAKKTTCLAFLLILGLLVFAGCARYDGVPDRTPRDRVLDNRGIQNNGGITDRNGNNFNQNGNVNGGNVNDWNNNTPNGGFNNNNSLGR